MSLPPGHDDIESQSDLEPHGRLLHLSRTGRSPSPLPPPPPPPSPPSFLGLPPLAPTRPPLEEETLDLEQYTALMRGGNSHAHRLRYYLQNGVVLFKPLSSEMETPFHVAVSFGDTHLLQILLSIAATYPTPEFEDISEMICEVTNYFGNNILHEVADSGQVKVLELLTKKIVEQNRAFFNPRQIKMMITKENFDQETPIFKASARGGQKMLRCMVEKIDPADVSTHHLRNKQNKSILEMAILGQHLDSAVWLLKGGYVDKLFQEEDNNYHEDRKYLHLLAKMPHVFKSGYTIGIWHGLIYKRMVFLLPVLPVDIMELEYAYQWQYGIVLWLHYGFWLFIAKVIQPINKVWEKKRTHSEAVKLLKLVLEKGKSWKDIFGTARRMDRHGSVHYYSMFDPTGWGSKTEHKLDPLLLAARNGIVEMVRAILDHHPIAAQYSYDEMGWNLLHVAVAYRREDVFTLLTEEWALPVKRLATSLMVKSMYTVLHQVSDNSYYLSSNTDRGAQFGPALELQNELRWCEEVEKITPNNLQFALDSKYVTARELFAEKHKTLHDDAKAWLKETSVSCSTVAVLIAGVAFAGACTVPGDYNGSGYPNLRGAALYKIFTVSDVVALTSSLISVVMFLSILTSPLPMRSFRHSLPKKLFWGFAALFVSVTATMLAFMAAVMLVIGMKRKHWTTSLAYAAVFLPVAIMGLVQLPLVYALEKLVKPAVAEATKKTMFHVTSLALLSHYVKGKFRWAARYFRKKCVTN